LSFNPTDVPGRFRPLSSPQLTIPTAYAAQDDETAIAERLLRSVDASVRSGPVRLLMRNVRGVALGYVACDRPLRLARLHGLGLQRLGLARSALIECGANRYAWTARWAQALHDADNRLDGLVWSARQNDGSLAVMLFGDRVETHGLRQIAQPIPLERGRGLRRLIEVCETAGVELPGLIDGL
jgi:hypothetical protein